MSRQLDTTTFGFLIADVARLMRSEMDRAITLAGIGLTPAEVRTLVHAARAGRVRQQALAEHIGVEPMTLSTHLDQLEAKGLVRREADPADRRAKLVTLTEEADAILDAISSMSASVRETAFLGLDKAQRDALRETLLAVRGNLCADRAAPSRRAANS